MKAGANQLVLSPLNHFGAVPTLIGAGGDLGNLVHFSGRRRRPRPNPPAEREAQILIFTGVQYQRGAPLPGDRTDPARPKRKRG
jgi:hypothetical protein